VFFQNFQKKFSSPTKGAFSPLRGRKYTFFSWQASRRQR
jgi:hypothetical protein